MNDLLGRVALDEKIGQLVQVVPVDMAAILSGMQHTQEMGQPFGFGAALALRAGILELVRAGKVGSVFDLSDPKLVNSLQRAAVEEARLGIPLIVGADVIHGSQRCSLSHWPRPAPGTRGCWSRLPPRG